MKKKSILELINKNKFFYVSSLLLIIASVCFLGIYSRADGFMIMNSFHTANLTIFFEKITEFGDGTFSLILSVIMMLFFKKYRELGALLLISYACSGILSQTLKMFVLSPRPSVYFTAYYYTFYLDTFSNCRLGFRSFPSGHSASIFAMVTVLTYYFKNQFLRVFLLLFAVIVGYSRIYLAHHFLIDVLVGGILGLISGTFSILWYTKNKFKIQKITMQILIKFNLAKFYFKK